MPTLSTASYRPRWELGTALAYLGVLAAVVADNWGLFRVGQHHRWGGAFLAVGVAFLFLILARMLVRRGDLMSGGLVALVAATALPWFVAALQQPEENLSGVGGSFVSDFPPLLLHQPHGVDSDWILVDVVALLWALFLLLRYRFPLLVVPAAFAIWFLGQEIAGPGNSAATPGRSAAAGFIVAAVLFGGALLFDRGWRREAFWLHLGAALSVVQGMLVLLPKYDSDAVAGTGFALSVLGIVLAIGIARSAYGVIGGFFVVVTGGYFVDKWVGASSLGYPFLVGLIALIVAGAGVVLTRRSAAT